MILPSARLAKASSTAVDVRDASLRNLRNALLRRSRPPPVRGGSAASHAVEGLERIRARAASSVVELHVDLRSRGKLAQRLQVTAAFRIEFGKLSAEI